MNSGPGTITIAAGSRDLTINTAYLSQGPVTWDIGSGRTLTFNNSLYDWNGAASLLKQGDGTAVLNNVNTFSGTITINGGTLTLAATWGLGVWNDKHPGTITVNQGGTLTASSVANFIANGLALNGGMVTATGGGNGDWGAYTLNSDVTAGNNATSTISAELALMNTHTFTVDSGSTLSISGQMHNQAWTTGGLIKAGSGTLVLSGPNSYTGTTTISAGTIRIQNDTALGAGGFNGGTLTNVSDGATLEIDGSLNINEHMHIAGSGVGGNGALRVLSGNSTLTTPIAFDSTVKIDVAAGASLTQSSQFYNGSGGAAGLTKSGDGTLTLSASNSYTGATTVSAGTLKLQAGSAPLLTDNFTATGNPNTLDLNYNLTNRQTGSAATQNWTGLGNVQVGNGTPVGAPAGTGGNYLLLAFGGQANLAGMPLSSSNVPGPIKINFDMFKGNTGDPTEWTSFTVSSGGNGFPVAGSGAIGFLYSNNTGIQVWNNGGVIGNFGSTSGGDSFGFYLADSAGTGSPFAGNGTRVIITQGGSVLGSYSLDTGMVASLIAFGSSGGMIGGVDNLAVNNFKTNVLDPSTQVSLTASGATLELDAVNQTVASLSGVSGSAVNLGPFSRLTVSGTNSTSFDGSITGTLGSLVKDGSGTLTLSGANTYTGATNVNGGKLVVNGSTSASSAVTVASGATLSGTGTVGGQTTIQSGGIHAPSAQASSNAQTFSGNLNYNTGSIFEWDLNAAPADNNGSTPNQGTYGQVAADSVTGPSTGSVVFKIVLGGNAFTDAFWNTDKSWTNIFTVGGSSYSLTSLFAADNFSGSGGVDSTGHVAGEGYFTLNNSTLTWTAVPEPTSALAGLLISAGMLRRRRIG